MADHVFFITVEEKPVIDEQDLVERPSSTSASRESTPRRLQKQIDAAIGDHRTSNSMINAVVGGVSTKGEGGGIYKGEVGLVVRRVF